jgi:hypothetical protein
MGEFPPRLRSSGLRFLIRLVSVVAALFVLAVTGRASAAPTPVGMCGERNESVEAPLFLRIIDDGVIRAAPCQSEPQHAWTDHVPLGPERVIVYERPERVLGFGALCVAQTESARLPIAIASRELVRPGFGVTPFRPPRG